MTKLELVKAIIEKGNIKIRKENRAEQIAENMSEETFKKVLSYFESGSYEMAWKKATDLSALASSSHEREMQRFFNGGYNMRSNKYFEFTHVINNDEIIIITNNIKTIKGSLVLVIGNDKVVWLKDWQVKKVRNFYNGVYGYAVKLNRQYFRTYQLNFEFEDLLFDKDNNFDDLLEVARMQDEANEQIALGW